MGWFESQIEQRRKADQQMLEDSFVRVAGVVLGKRTAERMSDERIVTKHAIDEILKYYHFGAVEVPDSVTGVEAQLDYCLRPHGLMRRDVELEDGWWRDAYGPLLGFLREGDVPVALLPRQIGGYWYHDPQTGASVRVNAQTNKLLSTDAVCFYRPLPQRELGIADLLLYMKRCLDLRDIAAVVVATFVGTLVGLLMPKITRALTGPVLASGQQTALVGVAVCMLCVSLTSQLIGSIRGMLMKRLEIKTSLGVQASMMMRLLTLPASFFRTYSAGELKSRSMSVNQLCSLLQGMVMTASLSSLTSLLYVGQIFQFAPVLVLPSLAIIALTVAFSVVSTLVQVGINKRQMELSAKESGMTYAMIDGVEKIKLAGAEKRIFSKWLDLYSDGAELVYDPPLFIKLNGVISLAITLVSNIVLYYLAVQSGLDQSSYFAFMAAYGGVMGAFQTMSGTALSAAQIRPILEMAEPFLKTAPETAEGKEIVTRLSGGVELDHVSFAYEEGSPLVLRDLSLKVRPGEYVAIVGRTGCGKSTLMRLLLGFETPQKGAVYYDGKNISTLDLPSLRRKIGTVMQDAGLLQGDIYSNIVITAPELDMDAAWAAAEKAGIADDIRAMPMGMHTVIGEGQGGISGGQRQRIMIARAIAPGPKILMFDEATSALDNKTQRQVSEALDAMGCTRIVIAHRLSTIRHCDRILVLEGGTIVEDGTYEELIQKGGSFAQLVERQRLEGGGGKK